MSIPQNLSIKVTRGQDVIVTNDKADGTVFNNSQTGYVWSDDRGNPQPGQTKDKVIQVSWVSQDSFVLWLSLEKFYIPTFGDIYPRGFGPEVLWLVTIKVVNGQNILVVENQQTLMGFLHVNGGGVQEMPPTFKQKHLNGHTWKLPNDNYVVWGTQVGAGQYSAMRAVSAERGSVDLITLTLTP